MLSQSPEIIEIYFDLIDSTQSYAKRELDTFRKDNKWRAILSNEQTAGRGQHDRKWVSKPNNLYVTFVFPFDTKELSKLVYLTQVSTIAVHQSLKEIGLNAEIKWKNDILINGKKISGVLGEAETMGDNTMVLIGIGINVNLTKEDCKNLDIEITSINQERNEENFDCKKIYQILKNKLFENIQSLLNGKISELMKFFPSFNSF